MKGKWNTFLSLTIKCCVILVAYFSLATAEVEPKEDEEVKPTVVRK